MSALPYTLVYLVPLLAGLGARLGGLWLLATPLFVFGLIPLLDLRVGVDRRNPDPAQERAWAERLDFKLVLWGTVPLQLGLLGYSLWAVASRPLSAAELVGLACSVGISNGAMGITAAHELIHRRNRPERALGELLLGTVLYQHFAVEHVHGHHARVATPLDPATGRLGQSFYRFWPRTVSGGWLGAWRLEALRLQRRKCSRWSPGNRVLRSLVLQTALLAVVGILAGPLALLWFVAQAVVAFSLLEAVNYVEHYGLQRRPLASGRWEPVTLRHSWNAGQRLTSWFLFRLQRHSDHHLRPDRRYPVLQHHEESPQLPTGYAGMVLLALVPPLWRRVMDPRVPESADVAPARDPRRTG